MHVWAIVNPVSGRRGCGAATERVARLLRSRGNEMHVRVTTRAGDATRWAAEAPPDTDVVLAAGGDGTIREVVDGLVGRRLPIAILPGGTENLIASRFRIPRRTPAFVEYLLHGQAMPLDVAEMNGRHFLSVSGIGLDAEVVHALAAARTGNITKLSYMAPFWRVFRDHDFPVLTVRADGDCVFDRPGLVFVGGIGRYALDLRLLARAKCDDGLLDLCCLECRTRAGFLAHAARVFVRRHLRDPRVVYRQAREIEVTAARPVAIEVDGDGGGFTPARYHVLPRAATLLIPETTRTKKV